MIEFVDCRTCKTDCVRADGNYGYIFCDRHTKPQPTNADRIRAMSDEELAKFIREPFCDKRTSDECRFTYLANCNQCVLDWLQQPAEEDDHA